MDSTDEGSRPGSRKEKKMKMRVDAYAHGSMSATGQDIGPGKQAPPNPDAIRGTSSGREAEFEHWNPPKGSALDPDP